MSYDLRFVPWPAGVLWEEADDAAEEAEDDSRPDKRTWKRIVKGAREILGKVDTFSAPNSSSLDHEPTGIQLTYSGASADITVPYWHRGDEAALVLARIYALGRVIEEATDFVGYDPQVSARLSDAAQQMDLVIASYESVTAFLDRGSRQ
jgi:hypothetical protein